VSDCHVLSTAIFATKHGLWLCSEILRRLTHERLTLCCVRTVPFVDITWVRVAQKPTCRGRGVYLRHCPRAQQKNDVVVLIDVNYARGTGYQGVLLCSIYSHQSMPETGKIKRMSIPCLVPFFSSSIRIFHLVRQYRESNTCCPTMKRYKHVLKWKKYLLLARSSFNIRGSSFYIVSYASAYLSCPKGLCKHGTLATADLLIS
jgi:hypothetical protein